MRFPTARDGVPSSFSLRAGAVVSQPAGWYNKYSFCANCIIKFAVGLERDLSHKTIRGCLECEKGLIPQYAAAGASTLRL
jgi:hypothetical protein